jgi:hypothetical protein
VEAGDADGITIVSEMASATGTSLGAGTDPSRPAARHSEERLEASELPVERRVDMNITGAIRKAAAHLG